MAVPMERFWKTVNPLTRALAGVVPWWVLVETTGHRTGKRRLTPLAAGPFDGSSLFLLAAYGESSAFVRNLHAESAVRVRRRGRWLQGVAEVLDPSPENVDRLGRYARHVLLRVGEDPKVIRFSVG